MKEKFSLSQPTTLIIKMNVPSVTDRIPANIYEAENTFIRLRDKSLLQKTKQSYDCCRALLKWASTCGASLAEVKKGTKHYYFHLQFLDTASLKDFINNVEQAVQDSTM